METILIVEDEKNIRSFLMINLKRNGYKVFETECGEEAVKIVQENNIDMVLLDLMLPGIDGYETSRRIRQLNQDIGIIMLTAKGQDMDKIMGLEYGADDYIVKPFNPMELILRIKAILRRIGSNSKDNMIKRGRFLIDTYSKIIKKDDEELELTPTEYLLMKLYIETVWGVGYRWKV